MGPVGMGYYGVLMSVCANNLDLLAPTLPKTITTVDNNYVLSRYLSQFLELILTITITLHMFCYKLNP